MNEAAFGLWFLGISLALAGLLAESQKVIEVSLVCFGLMGPFVTLKGNE